MILIDSACFPSKECSFVCVWSRCLESLNFRVRVLFQVSFTESASVPKCTSWSQSILCAISFYITLRLTPCAPRCDAQLENLKRSESHVEPQVLFDFLLGSQLVMVPGPPRLTFRFVLLASFRRLLMVSRRFYLKVSSSVFTCVVMLFPHFKEYMRSRAFFPAQVVANAAVSI